VSKRRDIHPVSSKGAVGRRRVDYCCIRWRSHRKEALEGDFVSTTREAFRTAHDISAYSLVALAREAAPLMTNGGSIVAMSYYGAEKVVPHYNVMGVAKASLKLRHVISPTISDRRRFA
jgi:enoyl-[acyl-carrier-protein] reductase (NADH)